MTNGRVKGDLFVGNDIRSTALNTNGDDVEVIGTINHPDATNNGITINSNGYVGIETKNNIPHHFTVESPNSFEPRIGIVNTNTDDTTGYFIFDKDPSDNAMSANDNIGSIRFRAPNTGGSQVDSVELRAVADAGNDSTSTAGRLGFYTTPAAGTSTERMRIDSSGNVGIGTTSPGSVLDVNGTIRSNSWDGTVASSGYGAVVERGSNANGEFVKFADGTFFAWNEVTVENVSVAGGGQVDLISHPSSAVSSVGGRYYIYHAVVFDPTTDFSTASSADRYYGFVNQWNATQTRWIFRSVTFVNNGAKPSSNNPPRDSTDNIQSRTAQSYRYWYSVWGRWF